MTKKETIAALKTKKAQLKESLNRFNDYLKEFESSSINFIQLKLRKDNFVSTLDEFNAAQSELESLEEAELSNNDRVEFENRYFELLAIAEQHIIQDQESKSTKSNSTATTPNSQASRIRLPKIELPKFNGSYEDWYNFYDSFSSLIHSNNSISAIEKFNYLKSSLNGDAADVIHSLEITEENYVSAWEILRQRYDNKRIIIQKHIKCLFDLPAVAKESHVSLRQLLDGLLKHLRALKALKRPAEFWDDLLIHLICSKLDIITNKEWETSLPKDTIPTLKELTDFMTHKCQILDAISRSTKLNITANHKPFVKKFTSAHVITSKSLPTCYYCSENHSMYKCDKFLKLSIDQRIKGVNEKSLCHVCFSPKHASDKCKNTSCRKCNKRHNSLIHIESSQAVNISTGLATSSTTAMHSHEAHGQVLLSTAIINVVDSQGNVHECRALLDSGSQSCFVTEDLAQRLSLKKTAVTIPVVGIGQSISHINHSVQIKIQSRFNAYNADVQCYVLKKITENLPLNTIEKAAINVPKNIKLADPSFCLSSTIDMLIGANLFWNLLCVGQLKTAPNQPYFQKTHLGWIVSGPFNNSKLSNRPMHCHLAINNNALDTQLTKFWEIEEYSQKQSFSQEESECEAIFMSTVCRNSSGRFVVKLPLREDLIHKLGDSRMQAEKRFYALERRVNKQPDIRKQYVEFIKEYEELGHMKLSSACAVDSKLPTFYLPHHAVVKETSLTTKLRVVFDGSAKTTSNISLNDALMVGPTIQQDLFSIVLRFRTYRFVMTADIAKMYRQVLVDPLQTQLQRILWRNHENEELKSYDLATVTYGTASASFLAIRALHQLANEEMHNFPTGAKITKRDFYVDDLLTGANSIEEATIIRNEVNLMLIKGGFELRKWVSNSSELVNEMSGDTNTHATINIDKDESIKTLGLQWNSHYDTLQYSVPTCIKNTRITKRSILSNIAQIFDPLGLLGPVIIKAKLIMQRLWQLKMDWDESIPLAMHSEWFQYKSQLSQLNLKSIPRCVIRNERIISMELHGFCDASELAYGACIYMRTIDLNGCHISLLCSKSRVAPLKNISLPRLELCGALLLAQLMNKVIESINMTANKIVCWSDSTITLAWIAATARTWKTFVANRVSEIQQLSKNCEWHHIASESNPADIISRGQTPAQLLECSLWWSGPSWLINDCNTWPNDFQISQPNESIAERRAEIVTLSAVAAKHEVLYKYSNYDKLVRIIAYCLRYRHNLLKKAKQSMSEIKSGHLSVQELSQANVAIIKMLQEITFSQELKDLESRGSVHATSSLLSLNPFRDDRGLIRVGGRLRNSKLPYDQKHPIILPKGHHVTLLIIKTEHEKQFHAGIQSTLSAVRTKYWPIGARNSIKRVVRQCLVCFKIKPTGTNHIMGDLPSSRITPARPFTNCGVDYFGPLQIKEGGQRSKRTVKAYGAIFVCFATKAVHIELVRDLSSEVFLNAFKRFISRRGKPANIYSDNGTNFVGANKILKQWLDIAINESSIQSLAQDGISWHFIPPRSPHFGGIWEAAVKSAKRHLYKVIGNTTLSFEELYTLLVQIEAILNSRPITPLSDDPNDLSPLTPGHFLIGDTLIAHPTPELITTQLNRLSRWQHVEQMRQHFWKRWTKEYLHNLQERTKWKKHSSTLLKPGEMVIIREDNLPPMKWLLGRIEAVHPSKDGVVRTASVRTSAGLYKRASTNLCPLPIDT